MTLFFVKSCFHQNSIALDYCLNTMAKVTLCTHTLNGPVCGIFAATALPTLFQFSYVISVLDTHVVSYKALDVVGCESTCPVRSAMHDAGQFRQLCWSAQSLFCLYYPVIVRCWPLLWTALCAHEDSFSAGFSASPTLLSDGMPNNVQHS